MLWEECLPVRDDEVENSDLAATIDDDDDVDGKDGNFVESDD